MLLPLGTVSGCVDRSDLTNFGYEGEVIPLPERVLMYWFGVLFASIGAALILGALTYVSILIGVLVNFMIILMSGPLIDKFLAKRGRRSA
ncbi:MAG: hypothetical protein H0T58_11410 [Gemmatimonadales bacterium]|nr:hypothetical protein [Gemmatimonadales bacterium]